MIDLADEITAHYERHAINWDADRRRSGWNDKTWIDRFVAEVTPYGSILDLGCGGGIPVGRHLIANGLQLTGVDSSPTLISLCRTRLPIGNWIVADMRRLSLGRRVDGILAWDSYFHLSQPTSAPCSLSSPPTLGSIPY
jgi:trans-aconitate methyltransferase